jgi:hypothetical protein
VKPYVYRASVKDAVALAPDLRAEDVAEIKAAVGSSPLAALTRGVAESTLCYAVSDDDGVFALFGVAPTEVPRVGAVWMLASPRLETHARPLLREARHWLRIMHEKYPVLWNVVDSRNETHVRFVRWLGCELIGRQTLSGVDFYEFVHTKEN